jgi:glycerol-3-phosphate dehydrogenase
MTAPHVVVIGAGSTGAAIAHDLALRGLRITVLERGGVASGVTGHNQAQLHSGARYCVTDPESARECIQENRILRRIMPEALELNNGLFVGLTEEHLAYRAAFLEACAECGIPARELETAEALRREPRLHPKLLAAIEIPDGVFDPYRFCLSFLATAHANGARLRTFTEVIGLDPKRGAVQVRDRRAGRTENLPADLIVNAAGPWAAKVAALAGARVEVEPSAGAMVTVGARLCQAVINLLAPPGDGDIIVPQRQTSILGTTSWTVSDPDDIAIPPEHIEQIFSAAEQLIPEVRRAPVRGVMAAARPLLVIPGAGGRAASRGFACLDHAAQGVEGLVSIIGGKTTTARHMAEKLSDLVCAKLGVPVECPPRARATPLLSHRAALDA